MMDVSEAGITLTIKKTKTVTAFAISFVIAVVLCFTDFITGNEISFSIFYLLPITTAVFLSGKTMGIVFSVISAVLWMIADVYAGTTYSAIYIPIWNAATRFGYFIFHTLLLSKLIVLIAEVREIGFKDPLTKAYNWRYFEEASNGIIKNALRKHLKLALVYFDVDNFKGLNDSLGHNVGDQALILISQTVRNEIRGSDVFARLGGDEFALLIQDVEFESAHEIIGRIQRRVNEEIKKMKWSISLSIGCKVFSSPSSTIGPMLKQVDDLMFEVKKSGKNNFKIVAQESDDK